METSMIGDYGTWAAGLRKGGLIPSPHHLNDIKDFARWRLWARELVLERMAPPAIAKPASVRTVATQRYEGLDIELLQWDLGYGRPTEAVMLKPAGAIGRLPGIMALHCHGGKKYWGLRKIARFEPVHPLMREHQEQYYGGRAWANEIARRGYVVLVSDSFTFGSRRVRPEECSPEVRGQAKDGADDNPASIDAYNKWAGEHENIMAKSLFCAGTTWPGVFWAEDKAALDVLAGRDDVDAKRIGCAGLSGGGLRTDFLAGLDERIACSVSVGFMTTWTDFLLNKCHTHTWMAYLPRISTDLDFGQILGLRAPKPTMVQNTTEDKLYTLGEVHKSQALLEEMFAHAGAPEKFQFKYYPGPHQFDATMQEDAFAWLDRWLK